VSALHRLGRDVGGKDVPLSHPAVFEVQRTGPKPRIFGAVPGSDPAILGALAACLSPPFHLLYVLHTARGEGERGRYQSPELSQSQVDAFLAKFAPLLTQDGRFDLWLYSPSQRATIVWDRHDQLYAYGPIDCFEATLLALGFSTGRPDISMPHFHHYRPEVDSYARALLEEFEWAYSPLRPEDEQ